MGPGAGNLEGGIPAEQGEFRQFKQFRLFELRPGPISRSMALLCGRTQKFENPTERFHEPIGESRAIKTHGA